MRESRLLEVQASDVQCFGLPTDDVKNVPLHFVVLRSAADPCMLLRQAVGLLGCALRSQLSADKKMITSTILAVQIQWELALRLWAMMIRNRFLRPDALCRGLRVCFFLLLWFYGSTFFLQGLCQALGVRIVHAEKAGRCTAWDNLLHRVQVQSSREVLNFSREALFYYIQPSGVDIRTDMAQQLRSTIS